MLSNDKNRQNVVHMIKFIEFLLKTVFTIKISHFLQNCQSNTALYSTISIDNSIGTL